MPVELGGGGVDQLRDVMAIASRVARGDSSLGIAVNMHLSFGWSLTRTWRAGNTALEPLLAANAAGRVWFCSGVTEAGTNYFHPRTTLRPEPAGGWRLKGHKVFATGSPAATHFNVGARLEDRLATVVVPSDTPGVVISDNWNGLGMRASGSGELSFDDVVLDAQTIVLPGAPWGKLSAGALAGRAFGNVGNLAAMLGIAEAARDDAVARIRSDSRVSAASLAERPTVRHHLAELEVDLATARAMLHRLGQEADEAAACPPVELADALAFMASYQEAKLVVTRCTNAVVDRALDLAGGGGYRGDHAQARRYRDIRAGGFMQPFSPHEALGFIGAVAAGQDPDPEA